MAHPASHHLHAGNIEIGKELLRNLVKLDRLPRRNSLQGMYLLRQAWNEYDLAMSMASKYKFKSKLVFALVLLLQTMTVVAAMLSVQTEQPQATFRRLSETDQYCWHRLQSQDWKVSPELVITCGDWALRSVAENRALRSLAENDNREDASFAITWTHLAFALSVATSFVAAVFKFMNPTTRWRQLRGGALTLEGIIWKYRARIGKVTMQVK